MPQQKASHPVFGIVARIDSPEVDFSVRQVLWRDRSYPCGQIEQAEGRRARFPKITMDEHPITRSHSFVNEGNRGVNNLLWYVVRIIRIDKVQVKLPVSTRNEILGVVSWGGTSGITK